MKIACGALLAAVGLFACDDDGGDAAWQRVEADAIAGVSFHGVHGVGEDLWAVGQLFDIPAATLVRFDGEGWSRVEGSVQPPASSSIWASSADDVWVAGNELWRWDGADWAKIDVSQALGGATATVTDVWGSGPDDVWVLAQVEVEGLGPSHVLRYDGTAWVERGDFATYLDPATTGELIRLRRGCAVAADDVWVVGTHYESEPDFRASELHHWDGDDWTFVGDARAGVVDLVCAAGRPWLTVVISEYTEDSWVEGSEGRIEGSGVAGLYRAIFVDEAGDGWIVGSREDRPQIWRWSGSELVETVHDGLEGLESLIDGDSNLGLRAVWQLSSGRALVFSVDGLVYQRDSMPESRGALPDLASDRARRPRSRTTGP